MIGANEWRYSIAPAAALNPISFDRVGILVLVRAELRKMPSANPLAANSKTLVLAGSKFLNLLRLPSNFIVTFEVVLEESMVSIPG